MFKKGKRKGDLSCKCEYDDTRSLPRLNCERCNIKLYDNYVVANDNNYEETLLEPGIKNPQKTFHAALAWTDDSKNEWVSASPKKEWVSASPKKNGGSQYVKNKSSKRKTKNKKTKNKKTKNKKTKNKKAKNKKTKNKKAKNRTNQKY